MTLEYIKKLMGWCPNAKLLETGSRISPVNFEAPDLPGGEKARSPEILSRFSRLYSRLDFRTLLPIIFLTPFYINLLFRKGVNAEALLLGLSLSLLIYLLGWKKQMRQYDALAKKPIINSSFKKTLFWVFVVLILGLILFMVFLSHTTHFLNAQSLYSFITGAWIFMGGTYLQLIYWERKNHLKIYIKSEKGFQKMYALGKKREEL
ncbi:DUF1673 domain-containing protein [Methanosarcina sp.]|uniref:DUF1673 domain-containing protein n=1 Tax=Methanosarcina sp. TaxID=2213 RepID=UPI002AB98778|nr:DUF1673 domain-containing protein [Methanosarcina sp.]MDY9928101.1 DUF1673 domain-containing protein [Methanosarcina sp.]